MYLVILQKLSSNKAWMLLQRLSTYSNKKAWSPSHLVRSHHMFSIWQFPLRLCHLNSSQNRGNKLPPLPLIDCFTATQVFDKDE